MKLDWDLSWNSKKIPDFTLCFEDTILVWIPCLVFFILSFCESLRTFFKKDREKTALPWAVKDLIKIILALILFVKRCPKKYVSFLSQITFNWFNELIFKGYRKPLTSEDMWYLDNHNTTDYIYTKFSKIWLQLTKKQIKSKILKENQKQFYMNIINPLLKCFWMQLLTVSAFKLISSCLAFISPIVLDRLITFMSPSNAEPQWRGLFYASLMFIAPLFESLFNSQYEYRVNVMAMRIRATLMSCIYKKSLKLSSFGRKDFTLGEIYIIDFILNATIILSSPFQITIAMILLWQQLGVATLAGLAFLVILMPFNGYMANKVRKYQMMQMQIKDHRVNILSEILNGIRVLKLYAWEQAFSDQVLKARDQEVNALNKMAVYESAITFMFLSSHMFMCLISFMAFVLISPNNILDANKAFVSLTLFNLMRLALGRSSELLSKGGQCLVSLNRINKFINAKEINENTVFKDKHETPLISIKNATFSWNKDIPPVLKNISLEVFEPKLVAVVGLVGAGKSSLLSALLGELEILEGKACVKGSVAYVPQEAWIQNKTLKENI
ncbi:unnamed protein product, partial [Medioppia subpectinata]